MKPTFPTLGFRLLALSLAIGSSPLTAAVGQELPPPPDSGVTAYLVTFGPGEQYWERFGHNAIWIRDPANRIDVMFDYGRFDFDSESFLLRFVQGRMLYSIGTGSGQETVDAYVARDRTAWLQELNLTAEQLVELRDFLIWNAQPENRAYRYHYYLDNCSTRLRDALDRVLDGRVREQFDEIPGTTFRFQTQRLTAYNIPYYTGLLIGLAQPVDRPVTAWGDAYVPMLLRDHIRAVTVTDEQGRAVPLVKSEQLIYQSTATPPLDAPPAWFIWYLVGGAIIAGVVAMLARTTRRMGRVGFAVASTAWMLLIGVGGIVLAALWMFTDHNTSYWNENLFFLTPIAAPLIVLLPAALMRKQWAMKPTVWLVIAVGASSVLGVLLKVLPAFYQVNAQLIALFLPVNLTIAFLLWQRLANPAVQRD